MISLQPSIQQIKEITSYNDATPIGILIAIVLASGYIMYLLYKTGKDKDVKHEERIQKLYEAHALQIAVLNKEYIEELKSFNIMLLKVNNQYSDSLRNINDSIRNLIDLKKS